MTETMRAMSATPEGVTLVEIPRPEPRPGEVRVAVLHAAVNAAEEKVLAGEFARRFLHARVTPLVLGWDFAGTVDAVGEGVTDLPVGARVWGHLAFSGKQTQGTCSEFVTLPRAKLAVLPDDVPTHLAAPAATCSMTALQSLRDLGRLREGGTALIIGAGGGVGGVGVGIASRLGVHVTAVCSTPDVDRVRAFGADVVIDRKRAEPYAARDAYDVVFDSPGVSSFGAISPCLRPGGAYVTTLPGAALLTGTLRALFSSKRCHFVQVASRRADLELVGGWLADGLQVTIDSTHPIADLGAALARQNARDRVGRVVVDVAGGWGG